MSSERAVIFSTTNRHWPRNPAVFWGIPGVGCVTVGKLGLNRPGSVIDLGINKGDFARIMHDTYGSCADSVLKPTPCLASNISKSNGIVCKNVAISDFDGYVKFSINEENSEASTIVADITPDFRDPVPSIMLSKFFREGPKSRAGRQIDVEGTELDIIETTEPDIFRRCTQIAVEFHRFLYPSMPQGSKKLSR